MDTAKEAQTVPGEKPPNPHGSFAEFFEREYPRLVQSLMPAAQDLGIAEEAAQEAMTRVFERWSRVSQMAAPVGYAYVIGVNFTRRRFRRPWTPIGRGAIDPQPDPTREVASRDHLRSAMACLPRGERDALLLVSFLGLSAEEAGPVLGIKPASVRSRLHRARASLQALKEEHDD